MGLRVVTIDGKPLTFGRAVVRMFGYFISTVPLYLGFAWVLIDNRRQGWHDKLARTCVIYDWEARHGGRVMTGVIDRQQARLSDQAEVQSSSAPD
jgi:uncharacterized RDD family membrane protein YckC